MSNQRSESADSKKVLRSSRFILWLILILVVLSAIIYFSLEQSKLDYSSAPEVLGPQMLAKLELCKKIDLSYTLIGEGWKNPRISDFRINFTYGQPPNEGILLRVYGEEAEFQVNTVIQNNNSFSNNSIVIDAGKLPTSTLEKGGIPVRLIVTPVYNTNETGRSGCGWLEYSISEDKRSYSGGFFDE